MQAYCTVICKVAQVCDKCASCSMFLFNLLYIFSPELVVIGAFVAKNALSKFFPKTLLFYTDDYGSQW